jgi:Xaa-Pro aminopeptidase
MGYAPPSAAFPWRVAKDVPSVSRGNRTNPSGAAGGKTPIISRLVSLEHPMEIRTGMVFALETYGPDSGGFSAARIKEEVMVTDTGSRVITRFPAEELPIANAS